MLGDYYLNIRYFSSSLKKKILKKWLENKRTREKTEELNVCEVEKFSKEICSHGEADD